jgi:hypothetical protein
MFIIEIRWREDDYLEGPYPTKQGAEDSLRSRGFQKLTYRHSLNKWRRACLTERRIYTATIRPLRSPL